jgi:hypothetical protein
MFGMPNTIDWREIFAKNQERHPTGDPVEPADDAEREFYAALAAYKERNRKPFPSLSEVLDVLLALGYRKDATLPRLEEPRPPRKGQRGYRSKPDPIPSPRRHKPKYS